MPAKPKPAPQARAQMVDRHVDSLESADRQMGEVSELLNAHAPDPRSIRENIDLAIGDNRIVTGLSRRARGCNLTPTVASAAFSWSFAASGDRMAVITVIGAAQPGCTLEFY